MTLNSRAVIFKCAEADSASGPEMRAIDFETPEVLDLKAARAGSFLLRDFSGTYLERCRRLIRRVTCETT